MSLTFDMHSAGDCLQDFRKKVGQFNNDELNTSLALDCAIVGWSVADWIFKCDGQRLGYSKLRNLQDEIRKQCPSLSHLQDIANARKHKEITKYVPLVKSTKKRGGAFSSGFSRDFDITRLVYSANVKDKKDAKEFIFWNTLQSALDYYEAYFKRNEIS